MAVGRPILCVGPESLSTVDFIKKYRIGYIVNNVNDIETALLDLKDKGRRQQFVDNAITVFNDYFLQNKMQNKLIEVLDCNLL